MSDLAQAEAGGWRERVASRSAGAARRKAAERAVGTGARLVRAAEALMAATGGTSFTVNEVAKKAGVSLSSVYAHFAGKDELVLAVFEDANRTGVNALQALLLGVSDPVERVRTLVREPIVLGASAPASGLMPVLSREQRRLGELFPDEVRAATTPIVMLLADEVEAAVASGAARSEDPQADAISVFHLIGSWLDTLSSGTTDLDPEQVADQVWRFCARALAIQEQPKQRRNHG